MDSISLLGPAPVPRGALTQEDFDIRYNFVRQRKKLTNVEVLQTKLIKESFRNYECLSELLPVYRWFRRYAIKKEGARDCFGAIVLVLLLIPQGLCVGWLIRNVPAALLSLLLPQLIYFILGSARHSSIGSLSHSAFLIWCSQCYSSVDLTTLSLLIAIIDALLFILPSHRLFSLFPSQLFLGFSLGIYFRIVLRVVPTAFKATECGETEMCLSFVSRCIYSLNLNVLGLFLASFVLSFLFRWKVNDIISQKIGTSFPHEILIIVLLTTVASFLQLSPSDHIHSSPFFPLKTPSPNLHLTIPSWSILCDAIAIAVFSVSQHYRISRSIAMEKMHKIDRKQEILSFSIISFFQSLFGLLPPSSSPGNSQINIESAKYSLLSNIIAMPLLFLCYYFGQHLIEFIPKVVISAIVLTTFTGVWADIRTVRYLLYTNTCDGIICIVSALSAILFPNSNHGFLCCLLMSLLSVVFRIQSSPCDLLVKVGDNLYVEENRYDEGECPDTPLRIIKITTPLLFVNVDEVRRIIYQQVVVVKGLIGIGIGSRTVSLRSTGPSHKESVDKRSSMNLTNIVITHEADLPQGSLPTDQNVPRFIVLDCCGMACIDADGLHMLSQVYFDLANDHIRLFFVDVNPTVRDQMMTSRFHERVPLSSFFPTLNEALMAARNITLPFHMSVSMNGYRDVIALSTAVSNQDISISRHSPEAV